MALVPGIVLVYYICMKATGTYHKDIFMPKISPPNIDVNLVYSGHAKSACYNDRYGIIRTPRTINLSKTEVIELTVENGNPTKVLVRTSYNSNSDLCLVILLEKMLVKTVWLNSKSDNHKSLDRSKYLSS